MIGITRHITQQVGRFRKKTLKKIKNLLWQNKNNDWEDLNQNWDG